MDVTRIIINFTQQLIFAHVAQGIERRFPKPQVAGSIPAVGTISIYSNKKRAFISPFVCCPIISALVSYFKLKTDAPQLVL